MTEEAQRYVWHIVAEHTPGRWESRATLDPSGLHDLLKVIFNPALYNCQHHHAMINRAVGLGPEALIQEFGGTVALEPLHNEDAIPVWLHVTPFAVVHEYGPGCKA